MDRKNRIAGKAVLITVWMFVLAWNIPADAEQATVGVFTELSEISQEQILRCLENCQASLREAADSILDSYGQPLNAHAHCSIRDLQELVDEVILLHKQGMDQQMMETLRKTLCRFKKLMKKDSRGNYQLIQVGEKIQWEPVIRNLETTYCALKELYTQIREKNGGLPFSPDV